MKQVKSLNFAGQDIYCGIDVHKKNWSICIRDDEHELKSYSQPPSPAILAHYLQHNYPQANFHAVYEAGFCGFWLHRNVEPVYRRFVGNQMFRQVINSNDLVVTFITTSMKENFLGNKPTG